MDKNRLEILQKIETGELSVEEGSQLLNELDDGQTGEPSTTTAEPRLSASPDVQESTPDYVILPGESGKTDVPDFKGFKKWSWVLFSLFLLLTGISAWWMFSAWQNRPFGAGFWLSWIPFGIGVLGMATSFNARWLHLRIREKEHGKWKTIRISFPLPLGIASWVIQANPGWLPKEMRGKNIGETLSEINQSITRDQPFYIEVDEEDEHVEIYIG